MVTEMPVTYNFSVLRIFNFSSKFTAHIGFFPSPICWNVPSGLYNFSPGKRYASITFFTFQNLKICLSPRFFPRSFPSRSLPSVKSDPIVIISYDFVNRSRASAFLSPLFFKIASLHIPCSSPGWNEWKSLEKSGRLLHVWLSPSSSPPAANNE